jgi:hypothetical protein
MVADCNFNIMGHVDAIINVSDINAVCQIKPVCEEDFIKVKDKGAFKKHVIETLVYMWLAELNDGILIYDNQNNNEYLVFHIEPYPAIIKSVKEKCFDLIKKRTIEQIPDRPYKEVSKECLECQFSKKCWKENKNG